MEWDIDKLGTFLEKKAREGVAIENKIYEWKLAELRLKASRQVESVPAEMDAPVSKAG